MTSPSALNESIPYFPIQAEPPATSTISTISSPRYNPVAVFLQDACLQHRFIRSRDTSTIVERPERIRAVKAGLSAAIARLEEELAEAAPQPTPDAPPEVPEQPDDLADAIARLDIASGSKHSATSAETDVQVAPGLPVRVVRSSAAVDLLSHPATRHVHGDLEGDEYLKRFRDAARASREKIAGGEVEIPEGLHKGDLYLCPESLDAVQGALGATCEAVDAVVDASREAAAAERARRAFVVVRPPGHHCGEDTPSGFCWVNNVAVGAAHAHLKHGINRIVILDIDLHHGNGTQSIVWQINEEAYREKLEREAGAPSVDGKQSMQIYYGSVHDILSYPCEDGKLELVQAASVSIHGQHGQHIENVHLAPYTSEAEFWDVHYAGAYSRLLSKAQHFLSSTDTGLDDALVFISAGFDASEHEHASMSRHGRTVPTGFYARFTADACAFADAHARGRLVSVLEGGYSDRALASGALAHLAGMVGGAAPDARRAWWAPAEIAAVAGLAARKKRGKVSLGAAVDAAGPPAPWLARAAALLAKMDPTAAAPPPSARNIVPPSSRTLRTRTPAAASVAAAPIIATKKTAVPRSAPVPAAESDSSSSESSSSDSAGEVPARASAPVAEAGAATQKKLPRVILKLGPRPEA